jgi:hypothetical protein
MSNEISKRELFSRHALGAGLGVGALALMAQTRPVSADTPFTSFPFSATGGVTPRTMPDRLSDVKNVKDYGAIGNGTSDDTAAIQSAINWTSGAYRGVIFFPAGTYRITSALTFNDINPHSIIFRGVGKASKIQGNFNGFLFNRTVPPSLGGGNPSIDIIENLWWHNGNSGTSSGCIRWDDGSGLMIRNCNLYGYIGFSSNANVLGLSIYGCEIRQDTDGLTHAGSIGVYYNGGGPADIAGCDFIAFDDGVRLGSAAHIHGCRFENNGNGINIGTDDTGGAYAVGATVVTSCSFEANDTGVFARSMNHSFIGGIGILGHAASPYSPNVGNWSSYGIRVGGGIDNIFSGIGILGDYNIDGVNIADATVTNNNNVWIGVTVINGGGAVSGSTSKWNIGGSDKNGLTFIKCTPDVVPMLPVTTFANLPASPATGMTYTITDGPSSVAAPGTLVTSGGGSTKMLLWYNGSNWKLVSL